MERVENIREKKLKRGETKREENKLMGETSEEETPKKTLPSPDWLLMWGFGFTVPHDGAIWGGNCYFLRWLHDNTTHTQYFSLKTSLWASDLLLCFSLGLQINLKGDKSAEDAKPTVKTIVLPLLHARRGKSGL